MKDDKTVSCFRHSEALIANDQLHAVQALTPEPLKKMHPTGFVLFPSLSGSLLYAATFDGYRTPTHSHAGVRCFAQAIIEQLHLADDGDDFRAAADLAVHFIAPKAV